MFVFDSHAPLRLVPGPGTTGMQSHAGATFNNITHGSAAGDSVHSGGTLWTNGGGDHAPPRSRDVGGGVRDIGFAARMAGESVDKVPLYAPRRSAPCRAASYHVLCTPWLPGPPSPPPM